ncbi:MAG: ABC transporter ATP-binding protein [Novosphingobium sp.]|nr:ABC transporter ATP-binding protein [Novosphingobium sp.]
MTCVAILNLTVRRAGRPIVADVTLALPERGLIGILGPNGAGKSTLARHLAGQPGAREGSIQVDGVEVAEMTAAHRAAMIGYIPQAFSPHWEISARMLVEMGASRRPDLPAGVVKDALAAAGLDAHADRPWSTLSGGEKARALLAAVAVADPQVLVADEPGASLDIRHRIQLMRRLADRSQTRLVVVVMHDIELATTWCDRLVVMDAGRIVADGASADIARSGVLASVFGVPFETVEAGSVTVARPLPGRD